MIICPICREEIDDDSRYCDQCGQALVYCSKCRRVGVGRRCTYCGGLMISASELSKLGESTSLADNSSKGFFSGVETTGNNLSVSLSNISNNIPKLTLTNSSLDINISGINGAVVGRRQGPYRQIFEQHKYVSGVHAQLVYKPQIGWCIIDKHSSNGTKLNQRLLRPDDLMSIKNGDIVTIANINLEVSIV